MADLSASAADGPGLAGRTLRRWPTINRRLRAQYAEIAQLAGGLAHEIRNPLSTMCLNLDLLAEDFQERRDPARPPRPPEDRAAPPRDASGSRTSSRTSSGSPGSRSCKLEPADLNAIVDDLRDFCEPQAATQGIVIRTHYADDLPPVPLDVDLFKQALLNLILNAEHAMPDGGELILTTRREGRWAVLDVTDTGVRDDRGGPRPDLRRLLLDPARRERPGPAHHPQDRRGPRRHDRRPERAGQGLAVHRPAARSPTPDRVADLDAIRGTEPPMDQQIRVLVVDDDEPHAEAVAESLERVGYECVVATSGREGLRLIEEQTFDIVLTDLIMDGVGGLEILAKAKRELPDAEVVILTGHGTIKTAVTAMQAGATHVPDQAARHRRAAHRRRQGVAVAAAGAIEHRAPAPAQREVRLRGGHRQLAADARGRRPAPPDRADLGHGPDHRRERHRQGAGRQGPPQQQPEAEQAVRRR